MFVAFAPRMPERKPRSMCRSVLLTLSVTLSGLVLPSRLAFSVDSLDLPSAPPEIKSAFLESRYEDALTKLDSLLKSDAGKKNADYWLFLRGKAL